MKLLAVPAVILRLAALASAALAPPNEAVAGEQGLRTDVVLRRVHSDREQAVNPGCRPGEARTAAGSR